MNDISICVSKKMQNYLESINSSHNYTKPKNLSKIINKFKKHLILNDVILILMQWKYLSLDISLYKYFFKKYNIIINNINQFQDYKIIYKNSTKFSYLYETYSIKILKTPHNEIMFYVNTYLINKKYDFFKNLILANFCSRNIVSSFLKKCKIDDFENIIKHIFPNGDFSIINNHGHSIYSYISITKYRKIKLQILINYIKSFRFIKAPFCNNYFFDHFDKKKLSILYCIDNFKIINKDKFNIQNLIFRKDGEIHTGIHLLLFNRAILQKLEDIL
jgi:hypothetical protein